MHIVLVSMICDHHSFHRIGLLIQKIKKNAKILPAFVIWDISRGGANTKVPDVYGVGWVPKGPKTQKYNGYFCTTKGWCPEGTPKTQKYKGTFVHKFP